MSLHPAPPSFQPNHPPPPDSPHSSSLAPIFPYHHAVPAQRVQSHLLHQSCANTRPTLIHSGIPSAEQRTAFARSPGQCILTASQSFHGGNDLSNDGVADNSFGQSSSFFSDPSSLHTPPRNHWDPESCNTSRGASFAEQSSPAPTSHHVHWCTKCDNPQDIKTCNGFKRHMREHETKFYCMPLGPVVRTEDGPKCAFCGVSNPDPKHLSTHNVELCASRPLAERSYVRKILLIKHLRNHGVDDDSVLADQWRDTVDKKYFACGFCGSCFGSLREQSNHVDEEHYRFSEDICDWDSNKAIRGLLSQPGIYDRWRIILAAYPRLQESFLMWHPALAKELHLMLEMREMRDMRGEMAGVFSSPAIDQSDFAGRKMDTSQSMQIFQHQDMWLPPPSKPNQATVTHDYTLPMTASALQSQQLAWKWNPFDSSNWDEIYGSRQVPQIASSAYQPPTGTTYYGSGHPTQPQLSSNGGESFMQQQHPAHVLSTASASKTAQVWGYQIGNLNGPNFGGRSQALSPDIATNPRSRQGTEAREYPAQAHTRGFHPALATESAPLPLSRSHPTSPLVRAISSSSPTERPTLPVRPPGREFKDNNGIDVNADLNDMQCTRQHQSNRRRQRRPR